MENHFNESNERIFLGHPGIICFFLELWERFSYYGMRALFTILVAETTSQNPGFGWSNESFWLYGWYTMLVYIAAILGMDRR